MDLYTETFNMVLNKIMIDNYSFYDCLLVHILKDLGSNSIVPDHDIIQLEDSDVKSRERWRKFLKLLHTKNNKHIPVV